MKRKIIKLGRSTYVTSLPSVWIREHNLEKGDFVELEEQDGGLRLTAGGQKKGKKLEIDATNIQDKILDAELEMAYTLGYETIEIIHGMELKIYRHPYKKKIKAKTKTTAFVQDKVNTKFIGMEVVEQSDKRTVIKDLGGGVSEEQANNIFKRILFLISQQAKESVTKEKGKLEALLPGFDNTRKFIIYYLRVLARTSMPRTEARVRTNIMTHLNSINSAYRSIVAISLAKNMPSKNMRDVLAMVVKNIDDMKSICLDYKQEKVIKFLDQRVKTWETFEKKKLQSADLPVMFNMGGLMGAIWYIVKEFHGMENRKKIVK
ncbi:hypothetical protein ACFL0V_03255 [Nanoarchaeota archaeon]